MTGAKPRLRTSENGDILSRTNKHGKYAAAIWQRHTIAFYSTFAFVVHPQHKQLRMPFTIKTIKLHLAVNVFPPSRCACYTVRLLDDTAYDLSVTQTAHNSSVSTTATSARGHSAALCKRHVSVGHITNRAGSINSDRARLSKLLSICSTEKRTTSDSQSRRPKKTLMTPVAVF